MTTDYGRGFSLSYRRLLAGRVAVGRYQLVIAPAGGRSTRVTFRIFR